MKFLKIGERDVWLFMKNFGKESVNDRDFPGPGEDFLADPSHAFLFCKNCTPVLECLETYEKTIFLFHF